MIQPRQPSPAHPSDLMKMPFMDDGVMGKGVHPSMYKGFPDSYDPARMSSAFPMGMPPPFPMPPPHAMGMPGMPAGMPRDFPMRHPSMPPNMQNMPNMPNVPNMPNMPNMPNGGTNPNNEHNFQYYQEYCRLHVASMVLNTQLRDITSLNVDLASTMQSLEKKKIELVGKSEIEVVNLKKKRFRRTANQIERKHKCPVPPCTKCYGSDGSLLQHLRLKHVDYYQANLPMLKARVKAAEAARREQMEKGGNDNIEEEGESSENEVNVEIEN